MCIFLLFFFQVFSDKVANELEYKIEYKSIKWPGRWLEMTKNLSYTREEMLEFKISKSGKCVLLNQKKVGLFILHVLYTLEYNDILETIHTTILQRSTLRLVCLSSAGSLCPLSKALDSTCLVLWRVL